MSMNPLFTLLWQVVVCCESVCVRSCVKSDSSGALEWPVAPMPVSFSLFPLFLTRRSCSLFFVLVVSVSHARRSPPLVLSRVASRVVYPLPSPNDDITLNPPPSPFPREPPFSPSIQSGPSFHGSPSRPTFRPFLPSASGSTPATTIPSFHPSRHGPRERGFTLVLPPV